MGFSARVLLDSISPLGARLTTMEARYPRFVHAEFMTHRVFSRNAASSRAIPVEKMIAAIEEDPVIPVYWGKNQSGMQAKEEADETTVLQAKLRWLGARNQALEAARSLTKMGIHKQLVNRVLEPYAWITVIVTGTEWENFFTQRCHPDAQPELQHIAKMMRDAYDQSIPQPVPFGQWHTPLILDDELGLPKMNKVQISVARCARVSYLNHDGTRDREKDLALYKRLIEGGANGHWSPFEHVATPMTKEGQFYGNIRGWLQYRKCFTGESGSSRDRNDGLSFN